MLQGAQNLRVEFSRAPVFQTGCGQWHCTSRTLNFGSHGTTQRIKCGSKGSELLRVHASHMTPDDHPPVFAQGLQGPTSGCLTSGSANTQGCSKPPSAVPHAGTDPAAREAGLSGSKVLAFRQRSCCQVPVRPRACAAMVCIPVRWSQPVVSGRASAENPHSQCQVRATGQPTQFIFVSQPLYNVFLIYFVMSCF